MKRVSLKKKTTKSNVHFSSKNPAFETDPNFFAILNEQFKFDLDLYASKANAKCKVYFSEKRSAETKVWRKHGKSAFGNPPYGRGLLKRIEHAVKQAKRMRYVVLLLPARVDTRWFRLLADNADIRFLKGRQSFYLHGEPAKVWSKKQKKFIHCKAPFPSIIAIMGKDVKPAMRLQKNDIYK